MKGGGVGMMGVAEARATKAARARNFMMMTDCCRMEQMAWSASVKMKQRNASRKIY